MTRRISLLALFAFVAAGLGLALSAAPLAAPSPTLPVGDASPEIRLAADGWGSVKGQVVFEGDKIPEPETLKVDKDQDHCLAKGPRQAVKWAVNTENKGLANVVVFLRAEPGQKLAVNDELKAPKDKEVTLDQPNCMFEPRILALRADQTLVAKNPAPVAHNIVIQGFKNSQNVQLSPGSERKFELFAEGNVVGLSCGAHPWMKGSIWIFDHPYFAKTDKDGSFEIKLAPAGNQTLVLWHEEVGYIGGKKGRTVAIPAGGAVDVGKIGVKPE